MAAPPLAAGPNRGALLRSVTSTTQEILTTHARHAAATERLAAETATKADVLARIAAAEAELAALEAQKKFESENDTELSSLQVWRRRRAAARTRASGWWGQRGAVERQRQPTRTHACSILAARQRGHDDPQAGAGAGDEAGTR